MTTFSFESAVRFPLLAVAAGIALFSATACFQYHTVPETALAPSADVRVRYDSARLVHLRARGDTATQASFLCWEIGNA